MKVLLTATGYAARDVLRSKWGLIFCAFFIIVTDGLFRLGTGGPKVMLSLANLSLLLLPLMSIIFGIMYWYNSREFVELLLTQPVKRTVVFASLFTSLAFSLSVCYVLGVTLPFLWHQSLSTENFKIIALLAGVGTAMIFCFVGLAFGISLLIDDKGKGLGTAILLWLLLAVVYDGIVLFIMYQFAAYPLEKPTLAMMLLNPIDLARVTLLLRSDMAALMGYTGAVFQKFFGTTLGTLVALASLLLWASLPSLLSMRRFHKKDF